MRALQSKYDNSGTRATPQIVANGRLRAVPSLGAPLLQPEGDSVRAAEPVKVMVTLQVARVVGIEEERQGLMLLEVEAEASPRRAICYPQVTGRCKPGDRVLINTTATEIGLGTGGADFVVCNLSRPARSASGGGHIMKLRYSPLQVRVQAAWEEGSVAREWLGASPRLDRAPVIACSLHSMLAPAAAMFAHAAPQRRLAYVMTDGGALPLAFSHTVAQLLEGDLLCGTVTTGHAFGGDYEAVGLYDGLVIARHVLRADAAIAAMGPGVVGTDSELGTSALEQGEIINATLALGGRSVAVVRLSFAEPRLRHRGVSHHTLTALRLVARELDLVAVPDLSDQPERQATLDALTATAGLPPGHTPIEPQRIISVDASATGRELARRSLGPTSMGRSYDEDPAFFQAAGAAGLVAARLLQGEL